MKIKSALLCALCVFFVFSCTSLQDVNIEQSAISGEFLEIHTSFALLDGAFAGGGGDIAAAENLVAMMDSELSNPGLLKASAARIYALKGCVALRLGRKGEAKKMYELSVSASKGDVYAVVLFHRLNPGLAAEENSVLGSDKAVLFLENALDFYAAKEYIKAVSRFDEAFLSLPGYYRSGYGKLRDESWSLRYASEASASNESLQSLLLLKKITVAQMLLIAEEDSDLLFNLTGGKNLGGKDLYKKTLSAGLLDAPSLPESGDSLSSGQEASISIDFVVNKFICARFLWNLYNENKTLDEKTKYSQRFSRIKMRSPVPDVPVSNPDFDAVLGCVENEFLNLEDGINFSGEKEVSALKFSASLKKIKK